MTQSKFQAVVIGASAGAVEALSIILGALPAKFSLPIMVVVHLPRDKKSVIAELLKDKCKIEVKEAEDKEPINPGVVYFAPPDYHLLVEPDKILSLSSEEEVLFSRPSIDVLFETAADAYGDALIGIILTGANNDGAKGLELISKAGGEVLIQNPDSAFASNMPQSAMKTCPNASILNLNQIAQYLIKVVSL